MALTTFDGRIPVTTSNIIGERQYIGTSINNYVAPSDGIIAIMYKKTGSNGVWYHYCTVDGVWLIQFTGYTNLNYVDTRLYVLKKGEKIVQQSLNGATIQANFYPFVVN